VAYFQLSGELKRAAGRLLDDVRSSNGSLEPAGEDELGPLVILREMGGQKLRLALPAGLESPVLILARG
jgi:hypothetical protein